MSRGMTYSRPFIRVGIRKDLHPHRSAEGEMRAESIRRSKSETARRLALLGLPPHLCKKLADVGTYDEIINVMKDVYGTNTAKECAQ